MNIIVIGNAIGSIDILSALARSCGLGSIDNQCATKPPPLGMIILGDAEPPLCYRNSPFIQVRYADVGEISASIHFGSGPSSPYPFKGKTLRSFSAVPPDYDADVTTEVIASNCGKPIWVTTNTNRGRCDTCWVSKAWVQKGESVFDHLNSARFMNLLPILEWLRWISGWNSWLQRPLRACFMFDDPNLHGSRYGFAKFQALASLGISTPCHTSFATVPLDSYYVSESAARIMRENYRNLSLLIHGNNHTKRELAREYGSDMQLAMMRQAIQRIQKLERKAQLTVSRIMAPPHGVCSAGMMSAMAKAGFEAVCVSHGSVRAGNPDSAWTTSLGASATTNIEGLPVINRFGLDRMIENQILLAAYLNQPIIPVGHHWDLAEGLEVLSSAANTINSLGSVSWSNMTEIARNNYCFKIGEGLMTIRTFGRKIAVKIPEDVRTVVIEADWMNAESETLKMRILDMDLLSHPKTAQPINGIFSVSPGAKVEFSVEHSSVPNDSIFRLPRTPGRVIARRLLVETRDRLMPYLPRKFKRR